MISRSREETKELAKQFLSELKPGPKATVVALDGDLGSGKTTFAQFIGEALGVKDHIQSPTFLIEKRYELDQGKPWKFLVHIDAYRLAKEEELLALGWQELASRPENLILVEWAERVAGILPQNAYHILFRHGQSQNSQESSNEDYREVEFQEGKS